ncbi:hypothetical protein D5R95_02655, partial [Methanosalsum natronophilum]
MSFFVNEVFIITIKSIRFIGYIEVDAGPLYAALANGDVDFTTNAWLPHIHQHFWEEYGE